MSDILLSSEKQGRFESMIGRVIQEEFDLSCDVSINSDGSVYVFSDSGVGKATEVMSQADEVLEVLSELEFEYRNASYIITEGDMNFIGASFYLKRDGW